MPPPASFTAYRRSIGLVTLVIGIRRILGRCDDRAGVRIDLDVEHVAAAGDFDVVGPPAVLALFVLGKDRLAVGVFFGIGDGGSHRYLGLRNGTRIVGRRLGIVRESHRRCHHSDGANDRFQLVHFVFSRNAHRHV